MVQITGKYEPVENINFYEFLLKMGIPEDKAKLANERKNPFDVALDGNKLRFVSSLSNKTTELVLGEEVDESLPLDVVVKSTAKQNGDVITIDSKKPGENTVGTRTLKFTDTGLEMKIVIKKDGAEIEAIRKYKRI